MSPVFRSATPADGDAILALLRASKLPVDGVRDLLDAEPSPFIVALDNASDDSLLAVAGVERCESNALLRSVAVRNDALGRGLGIAIVNRAIEFAESRSVRALYLLTEAAGDFFPRFGFTNVARIDVPRDIAATHEFSSDCCSCALVMMRPLSNAPSGHSS